MGDGAVPRGRCEIWVAAAPAFRPHHDALTAVLSPEERSYVDGLPDPATATLSRAVLRLLLARYLDVPLADVAIERTCPLCGRPHGRPRLRAPGDVAPPLQLSVSHGGDLLVLAFAAAGPLGVDVEPAVPAHEVGPELLELTLTPPERQRVLRAPEEERSHAFLQHWTAKEAVLKAVGTGLDLSPLAVTLTSPPVRRATVTRPDGAPLDLAVRPLDLGPGHVGAVATTAEVGETRLLHVSPAAVLRPPLSPPG